MGLRRARNVGLGLLGLQLIGFMIWSRILSHRFAISWDFGIYQQAAWLIGHGHLNPYSSLLLKPFWKNDGEFIIWPLALLVRIGPNLVTLQWVQDITLVCSEVVALLWMCDIGAEHTRRTGDRKMPVALVALGIFLMVGNPWMVWAISFDFHTEPMIALFMLGAARDIYRDRRRAWFWMVGVLLCGSVGAGCVGALGLSAILSGRWLRRRGLKMVGVGFVLLLIYSALHATPAHILDIYAPLAVGSGPVPPDGITASMLIKGILEHPARDLSVLWSHKANFWGSLSPAGLLGLIWLPVTLPVLLVLGEGGLGNGALLGFENPGFQNIALAPMVALGTVAILTVLWRRPWPRFRRLMPIVMMVLAANTVVWSVIWLPQVSKNWLLVSPSAASTLRKLLPKISHNDQMLVSQGIVGAFSERQYVQVMFGSASTFELHRRKVWIILSPLQGIELGDSSGVYSDIEALEQNPAMHLVADSNGVWAFEWNVPRGVKSVTIGPLKSGEVPGWVSVGGAGKSVTNGPQTEWYVANTAVPGYVDSGTYWRGLDGLYRATVKMSVSAGTHANAEVWDSTTNTLLTRKVIRNTDGVRTISMAARLRTAQGQPVFEGHALWAIRRQTRAGDDIEIRVWSPGTGRVRVYQTALTQLTGKRFKGESTAQAIFGVAGG